MNFGEWGHYSAQYRLVASCHYHTAGLSQSVVATLVLKDEREGWWRMGGGRWVNRGGGVGKSGGREEVRNGRHVAWESLVRSSAHEGL